MLDQGDLVADFPLLEVNPWDAANPEAFAVRAYRTRVIGLTQTCDLANGKASNATVAEVFDAQYVVDAGYFKPADLRGSLRSGRVWGWYFLPADADCGLPEMVIDLRRLHTARIDMLHAACRAGGRQARLYREHRAKHFADTFSRIGLPRPYETL